MFFFIWSTVKQIQGFIVLLFFTIRRKIMEKALNYDGLSLCENDKFTLVINGGGQ
jgi:hypothetical protein